MGHKEAAVTWIPRYASYIQDQHMQGMPNYGQLLASVSVKPTPPATPHALPELATKPEDPRLYQVASLIAKNKQRIMFGQLSAADFGAGQENLSHLIMIRLHNQLMAEQMRWFYLDNMFNTMSMEGLLYRMSFRDNVAVAQEVGPRNEYDTTLVKYDTVNFSLPKIVVSYDIPIEDPLKAMISPIAPLQESNSYSMAYYRENEALKALQKLKYHYTKDANKSARFTALSAAENNSSGRLSDPSALTAGSVHSDHKIINEIQDMRVEFLEENDTPLSHFAMSPKTATALAQNTWTEENSIFNVSAYRTAGGVRSMPGLDDATAVISQLVPNDVIYAIAKQSGIMVKAEGPKITKTWENHNKWTTQTATADFHQYKCAHEDLTMDRKFGCILNLNRKI